MVAPFRTFTTMARVTAKTKITECTRLRAGFMVSTVIFYVVNASWRISLPWRRSGTCGQECVALHGEFIYSD